ncbi:thiamine diphosphokinase [Desulfosporosinus sp. BICA1-9]|uniref:thiamine diphosphokinase n=1 Tax=Desulfosporosinus sp. BICA1-9 TaxID=1531958 RepID=UPI00054BCCC3|nr:thiamine diphosphokinase [Desulfosporosinus sp. BICA1-9]KJS90486.1 MAG: thiamine pyrophosphokinase [Desulfosporosinus sp. BICA1-9]HBW38430.1 thiamine diphosphokinase [Desulfosporosinus sp.]
MNKFKIAVLANGVWDSKWGKHVLNEVDFLICADGGANYAALSECMPDLVIGDLDSISPENLSQCETSGCIIERYPSEKDETDLELAFLRAVEMADLVGERDIWLYGATGNRIDHFLGNIALMLAYARKGYRIRLVDPEHEMWVLQGREEISASRGQELSLISLSEQAVVTTEGLYYPLDRGVLYQDSPRGISNVFLGGEAVIEVHQGWVMVVIPNGGGNDGRA